MNQAAQIWEATHYRVLAALSLLLLAFMAYANTVDGDWVWDDASSVLLHETVQSPSQFLSLFAEDQHRYGRGQGNFYRPLVALSFTVDYVLSGGGAIEQAPDQPYPPIPTFFFHLTNILWHSLAAILLFFVLLRLGAILPIAWAVSMLYVVHPLHTEAVAYMSGRADMMSGAAMFLGIYCALRATTSPQPLRFTIGAVFAFTLGMLSKESTAMFPFLLALLALLRPIAPEEAQDAATRKRNRWLPVALTTGVLLVYAALRMTLLRFAEGGGDEAAPFLTRLVETGQAFTFYIQKLFLPTGLHMEQTLSGVPGWTAIPGFVLLAAFIALAVFAYRAGHWRIAAAIGWFLLTWFPISGIFPLNAPMAEHWMYVPMAGFWWALAEVARLITLRIPSFRTVLIPATAALVLLFIALTVQRNADWHDNETLFRATLRENPDTMRVQYNLAVTYEDLLGNDAGARRHFRNVLQLQGVDLDAPQTRRQVRPEEIDVRLSLGNLAMARQDYEEAAEHYQVVAGLNAEGFETEVALASLGIGKALMALGEAGLADRYFLRALELIPELRPELEAILNGAPIS